MRQNLSKWQRKRLARLQHSLKDSPVRVLDEWAVDEYLHARDHFYRVLLPAVQRDGKTLSVISYDDIYFDLGERVIGFQSGDIVSEKLQVKASSHFSQFRRSVFFALTICLKYSSWNLKYALPSTTNALSSVT